MGNATDHLANERTFLAWVRTGLGMIVFGFAIGRFGIALRQLTPATGAHTHTTGWSVALGTSAMVIGVLFLGLGLWRYRRTQQQIEQGAFKAEGNAATLVTVLVVMLGLALIAYLGLAESRLQ
jgi:putative membrane protein